MKRTRMASVVVPVRDQVESLRIVLRFFNYQELGGSFEVIVVDDGSRECVERALHADACRYPVRVLTQRRRGRAAARNRGVAAAQGDLLVFCDADRIPDPGFVKAHLQFHEDQAGAAAFGCPWDCFLPLEKLKSATDAQMAAISRFSRKPEYYRKVSQLFDSGRTSSKIAWAAFLAGNASLLRADFERAGGFDEDFKAWGAEHFELGFRLLQNGTAIFHNSAASSYHIPHYRKPGFFRSNLRRSLFLFSAKHPGVEVGLLGDFLLGRIPLQEFERRFSGRVSKAIASKPPIRFAQLAEAGEED